MNKKMKLTKLLILILLLILMDQIIKFYIENVNESIEVLSGVLRFTYSQNTGGAFSIGKNSLPSIIVTNVIILGIIIKFMITNYEKMDCGTKVCLSLILSGGISNFIDRVFKGYVVDFIDFTQCINFPIFNLADIFVVLGWMIFIFLTIRYALKK